MRASDDVSGHLATVRVALLAPARLWTRADILSRPCPVPVEPGVYAWYVRTLPPGVPSDGCHVFHGLTLLYIGIAPKPTLGGSSAPSQATLRSRLRMHVRGNASGSTLRLSLGCLLHEELGIELRRIGNGARLTFGDGEQRLSAWLATHALVAWCCTSAPHAVETALIHSLSLPLNLDQNDQHPFHATLTALRAAARARARALPIVEDSA